MEERVSPANNDRNDDRPPLGRPRPLSLGDISTNNLSERPADDPFFLRQKSLSFRHALSFTPRPIQRQPSLEPSETYVVQIPKDQIYRVPPPENAAIAQRFRQPEKKERSGWNRWLGILIILVVLAAILGATIGILEAIFKPKVPTFSIVNVSVKNPSRSTPIYSISMEAKNSNERMEIVYGSSGYASLLHKQKIIASGKFPEMSQDANAAVHLSLSLKGSKGSLPADIKKSMQRKHSKQKVSLTLQVMKVSVAYHPALLQKSSKIVNIACQFEVNTLGKGSKVKRQDCTTQFVS